MKLEIVLWEIKLLSPAANRLAIYFNDKILRSFKYWHKKTLWTNKLEFKKVFTDFLSDYKFASLLSF